MISRVPLGEIIEKPISGEWGKGDGPIKVLRTTNFTNRGVLDLTDVVEREIDQKKVDQKKLRPGDIIIEKSGGSPTQPVGRVVFFNKEGLYLCNNFTSVLRPKGGMVFPKYLHYVLFANHQFGLTGKFQNKTTGIINLKLNRYIENSKIPLPPLAEQKRIAAILDAADAYRQKTRTLIGKYDELAQSLFLEMFGDPVRNEKGWEKIQLQELSKITSGSTPTRTNENYFKGNIPWVKTGEVDWKIIEDTEEKISDEALNNSSCTLYPKGSLIIAMYGQGKTRGKVGILNIEATTNQACAVIPPSTRMNYTFLFILLKMSYNDLRDLGRGGNQPNLNTGLVKNYNVIDPPIDLQNQFTERIRAIESQKSQAQKSLEKAEELFQSLLQRAFRGELAFQEVVEQEVAMAAEPEGKYKSGP